jgi:hypothetical protein
MQRVLLTRDARHLTRVACSGWNRRLNGIVKLGEVFHSFEELIVAAQTLN